MNDLIKKAAEPLCMTSREIAALTGKDHGHILRDIRQMLEALKDDPELDHVCETKDRRGYTAEIALPKALTLTLVSGYNVVMRKRIIDRWLEIEGTGAKPALVNLSRLELLQIAMQAEQERLVLEAQVAEQAPKVEFHDAVAVAVNAQPVAEIAKVLRTGQRRMFAWLRESGLLMGNNLPYQRYVDQGWFSVIEKTREDQRGEVRVYAQTLVTGKGLSAIQRRFAQQNA